MRTSTAPLGSLLTLVMLLEGFIMLNLYPVIKNKLADRPEVQEQMVKVIQGTLFVANVCRLLS